MGLSRAVWLIHFFVFAILLGIVAAAAPTPWWPTDRAIYERIGREFIVRDCAELHCFRVLVPWMLGRLPGDSVIWWKAYAVAGEAAAGVAMGLLVAELGASSVVALQIAWMTAFGAGALYTLFDPHTADPVMHVLSPVLLLLLLRQRFRKATIVAAIGVFAKEFAVVPLVVMGVTRALQQRMREATQLLPAAAGIFVAWLAWQGLLRLALGYTTAASESAQLLRGSFIVFWLLNIGLGLAIASIVMVLGVLWVLWPVGLWWGPRELRQLAFASLPVMLIFCAVQQPDRALWNFAFLAMPAAAIVLDRVPAALGWVLVTVHVVTNLRVGAQLAFVPPAKITLALSALLALACIAIGRRRPARIQMAL